MRLTVAEPMPLGQVIGSPMIQRRQNKKKEQPAQATADATSEPSGASRSQRDLELLMD
jgi:hypothetical protein